MLKRFMVKPHTSDIRMTFEYIRVTYGWHTRTNEWWWHTRTYEWHTNDTWVHTSDMRMTYEYIRVTYGWHTNDIRMTCGSKEKENHLFKSFLIILLQNIWFVKGLLACNGCFGLIHKIKKGSGINFWCTISAWFFHTTAPYLILYQLAKFQSHTFFTGYRTKCVN